MPPKQPHGPPPAECYATGGMQLTVMPRVQDDAHIAYSEEEPVCDECFGPAGVDLHAQTIAETVFMEPKPCPKVCASPRPPPGLEGMMPNEPFGPYGRAVQPGVAQEVQRSAGAVQAGRGCSDEAPNIQRTQDGDGVAEEEADGPRSFSSSAGAAEAKELYSDDERAAAEQAIDSIREHIRADLQKQRGEAPSSSSTDDESLAEKWEASLALFMELWLQDQRTTPLVEPAAWKTPNAPPFNGIAQAKAHAYAQGVAHGYSKGFGRLCRTLMEKHNGNLYGAIRTTSSRSPRTGKGTYTRFEEFRTLFKYFEGGPAGCEELPDHRRVPTRHGPYKK